MTFDEFNISKSTLNALKGQNYEKATPIQEGVIPVALDGSDIVGLAQTGSGKTAAFAIPIIEQLLQINPHEANAPRRIKALILSPTRELAIQIAEVFGILTRGTTLRHTVIYGGVKQANQVRQIHQGCDILVATPGRLLDLIQQKIISLSHVKHFVLDEADRMLDMGFIHDIRRLLPLIPKKKQTMLFSATMPKEIEQISNTLLHLPKRIEVTPVSSVVDSIEQKLYLVEKPKKIDVLVQLLRDRSKERVLVFSRTKHGADKIARLLKKQEIPCEAIHGNKSQNARQNTLSNFKTGKIRIIIATDIAARGIDIQDLGVVINYDVPDVAETYVHRIGRTGRAGKSGIAMTLYTKEEQATIKSIQKLTGVILKPIMVSA